MSLNFIDPNDPFLTMIRRNNFVVLDTETTGLYYPAEIVQIAVLDFMGSELLNTLVKPKHRIPESATAIHHITDGMVDDAKTWVDVREEVMGLISGYDVVIYNANYDMSMLESSDHVWDIHGVNWYDFCDPHCAMLWYAALYGEWNDHRNSWRWQKLISAVHQNHLNVERTHDALGDCKMTYALVKHLLAKSASDALLSQFIDPTLPRDE